MTNLYANALGRQPSGTELTNAISLVTNGGTGGLYNLFYNLCIAPPLSRRLLRLRRTRLALIRRLNSRTAVRSPLRPITATICSSRMLYFSVLARDPDASGYNFWLGIANGGGSGIYFQNGGKAPRPESWWKVLALRTSVWWAVPNSRTRSTSKT